jgi:histidinol-phosphatase (PHP family)
VKYFDLHVHTEFCDGRATAEEMVKAAIALGCPRIGLSSHAPMPYGDYAMAAEREADYRREILRLRAAYREKIEVLLGLDVDLWSLPFPREEYDYIIGSCHYIHKDGAYYSVDSGVDFRDRCLQLFGGDPVAYAESYFAAFTDYILKRKPDIVGHFDLITKFDELGESRFLQNPAYNKLAEGYVAEAAKSGSIFEVNTGAICRGMRTTVYPSENLLYVLKKSGTRLILSSDSHAASTLDFYFDEAKAYLRDMGFRELYTLRNGEFVPYAI